LKYRKLCESTCDWFTSDCGERDRGKTVGGKWDWKRQGGSSERPRIRKEMQNVNPISVQIS